MVFGNGVKNIQAAAYNGARTVCFFSIDIAKKLHFENLSHRINIQQFLYQ